MDYLKKQNVDFIRPDMWLPNSPGVNPVDIMLFGVPFSNESITDKNLTRWKNEDSYHRVTTIH